MDKCLPFGLSSAPFLFNQTAEEWILKHVYRVKHIIHYLDDFFIVDPAGSAQCQKGLEAIRTTVELLGITIAVEKNSWPYSGDSLPGYRIGLEQWDDQAALPEAHGHTPRQLCKYTKRSLLSLISKLSFATKVVPAGQIFLRCLIDESMRAKHLEHHITLTHERLPGHRMVA